MGKDKPNTCKLIASTKAGLLRNYVKPAISSNSKKLYLASSNDIKVYSLENGQLLQSLRKHEHAIVGLCSNLEDIDLISCDERGNVVVWDPNYSTKTKSLSLLDSNDDKDQIVTFFGISEKKTLIYALKGKSSKCLISTELTQLNQKRIISRNFLETNSIAFNRNGNFLAVLEDRQKVTFFKERIFRKTIMSANKFTCVACHPSEYTVAVGNIIGQIIVYYNADTYNPIQSVLHWHTLPVANLSFSSKGTELYSCGGECVLVQWQLTEERRYFFPRLGGPLQYVVTDDSNTHAAVVHKSRDVSVLKTKERLLTGKISGLMYHDSELNPQPIGLFADSLTNCVILNGSVGHVQFFDPFKDELICHLDVTMCNFASNERNQKIPNPEVVKSDISSDGCWLATCESCPLMPTLMEISLKFWHFSQKNQGWELNTSIQMPHQIAVNSMSFVPMETTDVPLCITCGEDKKFKMWKLFRYNDAEGNDKCHWNCIASKEFRNLPATACAVSPDGSLLAVTFNEIISMWKVDSCSCIGSLFENSLKEKILQVAFCGGEQEGAVLVARSKLYLSVWNLLTCSLLWSVHFKISCLAVDPLSGYIAAFSYAHEVLIFSPKSKIPVAAEKNIYKRAITGTTFLSNKLEGCPMMPWNSTNHLVFIDDNQILGAIELKDSSSSKDSPVKRSMNELKGNVYMTPFSALMAKTRNEIESEPTSTCDFSLSLPNLIEKLDETRIHNMESFSSLLQSCDSYVPSISSSIDKLNLKTPQTAVDTVTLDVSEAGDVKQKNTQKKFSPFLMKVAKSIDYSKLAEGFS